ncbi:patatin-like phospholipase family protein [Cellulosimicrobium cellulans]|uniref:patatin-like phospholipase family protein n=1 Tax=Cellulosimicrobium cellulans TaxID=1710 RepID=UPI001FCC3A81|nr:patatin-like phospholipase family protein [Cellulosimicrobium cellulans]
MTTAPTPTAFVLGGGGVRGAVQIGMLRALLERGITPDLVVGTSIGAINGAALAADPTPAVVPRLESAWSSPAAAQVYGEAWYRQVHRLATTRTHLASPAPLRALLRQVLGERTTFADLAVPLVVAAASIERAAERWFSDGPLVEAVLASASVPGALPRRASATSTTSTAAWSRRSRWARPCAAVRGRSGCSRSAGSRNRCGRPGPRSRSRR